MIELIAIYEWWQIYLFLDASYLIMTKLVIFPSMWKSVKDKVGVINWKKSRYSSMIQRFIYETIAVLISAIMFPLLLLVYIINEKQYMSTLVSTIAREIKKEVG